MSTEIAVKQTKMPNVFENDVIKQTTSLGELMAAGKSTMPTHLQGKPADCTAIAMQAFQWGMNPFAVAQKTHLVNGTLGYEAQLVNAVISSSTAIEGRFHYEYGGDWKDDRDPTAWVKVGAILKGETDIQWGEPLYPANVTTKNSPLWKTAPKQQAAYLAVKYWARLYCPAVILGVYTSDEVEEFKGGKVTPIESAINREPREVKGSRVEDDPVPVAEPETEAEQTAVDTESLLSDLLKQIEATTTIDELNELHQHAKNFEQGSDEFIQAAKAWKAKKATILRAMDAEKQQQASDQQEEQPKPKARTRNTGNLE
jgi:hypothetical protein